MTMLGCNRASPARSGLLQRNAEARSSKRLLRGCIAFELLRRPLMRPAAREKPGVRHKAIPTLACFFETSMRCWMTAHIGQQHA